MGGKWAPGGLDFLGSPKMKGIVTVGWGMDVYQVCVYSLFCWMSFCVYIPFWLETGVLFRMNVFCLLLLAGFDVILMCIQIQMFRELSLSRFWLGWKGCG